MSKTLQSGKGAGPPARPRRRKPRPQVEPAPRRRGDRRIEVEWRRNHYDELLPFAGQWVVLEREDIVAHGDDAVQVVEEARRKGVEVPFIFRVEPDYGDNVATMGL